MDSETFLDYVENLTYKSFRAISQDYENKDISNWLRSQELDKNIVVVKNCSEELESFYNERNTGDKKLVEKLVKRGSPAKFRVKLPKDCA
jgi:aspartyl/asparaginyl-tRNA synthetase